MTSRHHKKRSNKRGAIMLELIAALGVLSISGLGMYEIYHVGIRHIQVSQERAIASRYLENAWEQFQQTPLDAMADGMLDTTALSPAEHEMLSEVSTQVEVYPYADSTSAQQITITIEWDSRAGRHLTESVTSVRAF